MGDFRGSHDPPRNYEIVDCDTFCEVIFFCISPKNLLGDFFDSLSRRCGTMDVPIEVKRN